MKILLGVLVEWEIISQNLFLEKEKKKLVLYLADIGKLRTLWKFYVAFSFQSMIRYFNKNDGSMCECMEVQILIWLAWKFKTLIACMSTRLANFGYKQILNVI